VFADNGLSKVWTLTALMVACCMLAPTDAPAQSRSSLQRRLSNIEANKAATQRRLRAAKAEQLNARNELTVAQRELAKAEQQLKQAEWQLANTRSTIRKVKQELENTKNTLQRHQKELHKRMVVTYKAGTPSYIEVLLNATDFNDFATRADLTRRMAEEDSRLLQAMLDYQKHRETQKGQLRAKESEQVELRKKVTAERNTVAIRKRTADGLVKKANSDRATAERQMAEWDAASRAIENMLANMRSGSGIAGAYKGEFAGTLAWPMSGRISSPFGMRTHPITGRYKLHTGMDIARSSGTPIRAAAKGRVVFAGWKGAYGVTVIIDHGSGIATLYGHCQSGSIRVFTGQTVSRGQTIARCGSTGWSTGPHLHFEVRRNGQPRNPADYL
jgi:murein DD-endopeptidase MepM/ murein hydrolase activator NlpD